MLPPSVLRAAFTCTQLRVRDGCASGRAVAGAGQGGRWAAGLPAFSRAALTSSEQELGKEDERLDRQLLEWRVAYDLVRFLRSHALGQRRLQAIL